MRETIITALVTVGKLDLLGKMIKTLVNSLKSRDGLAQSRLGHPDEPLYPKRESTVYLQSETNLKKLLNLQDITNLQLEVFHYLIKLLHGSSLCYCLEMLPL